MSVSSLHPDELNPESETYDEQANVIAHVHVGPPLSRTINRYECRSDAGHGRALGQRHTHRPPSGLHLS